jgi:MFS family permease
VVASSPRPGRILLVATVAYGLSALLLAWAHTLLLALAACLLLGAFDAMTTTIRQAAVQLETPDELRGRVSAIYQMASRGGPALGDTIVGAGASVLGPAVALTAGGALTIAYVGGFIGRNNPVRSYTGTHPAEELSASPAP